MTLHLLYMQCPFHGKIIPRDEHGSPVHTDSSTSDAVHSDNSSSGQQVEALGDIQSSSKEAGELWRDLQMQNDIMTAAKLDSQPDTGGTKKRKGNEMPQLRSRVTWSFLFNVKICHVKA